MSSDDNRGTHKELPITSLRALAESILGAVDWKDEFTGYGACPGGHAHTTGDGVKDCQVKIDGVPTIHCVHASCKDEVQKANKALRTQTLGIDSLPATPETRRLAKEARVKVIRSKQLEVLAGNALPRILKNFSWPYEGIVAASPVVIDPQDRKAMVRAFLDLYEDDDVIWIGDVTDTGKVEHSRHFKTKLQWVNGLIPEDPLTCPACFAPGSVSRSKDNVIVQRLFVVESDTLSKDQVGALFKWLDQEVGLPLRAVVDTAGKSLHGWFDYPNADTLAELKVMLPAMGCDSKMFGSSQPCRLPGGLRDGKIQRLIYVSKGGAK